MTFLASFSQTHLIPKPSLAHGNLKKNITFYKATFVERAIFIGATFVKEADFVNAIFIKGADFSAANFKDRAYFPDSTFLQKADFREASFMGKVDFSKATFDKMERAFFFEANFMEEVDFYGASFEVNAIFQGVNFNEVDFSWAKFKKDVSFYECIFKKEASFFRTNFNDRAFFDEAVIKGRMVLRSLNPLQEGDSLPSLFQAEFRNLQFRTGGRLHFQDMSVAYCKFADTDLSHAEFHHVQWYSYRGRHIIYDEILLRKDAKERFWKWFLYYMPFVPPPKSWSDYYGEVERLYRYLKINYEKAGDYKNAGDFHYGEMEMHRKEKHWRRWISWYSIYWALSGYGESPGYALIVLIFVFFGLSGLVFWFGINQFGPQAPASYDSILFFILEKALLQRPAWPDNINQIGKFFSILSVLLLPGQAALFLLALRNRLGRRR